jgi:hypothetical protein
MPMPENPSKTGPVADVALVADFRGQGAKSVLSVVPAEMRFTTTAYGCTPNASVSGEGRRSDDGLIE